MLFNLGENLGRHARAAANAVAERSPRSAPRFAADPRTHSPKRSPPSGSSPMSAPQHLAPRRAPGRVRLRRDRAGFLPDAIAAGAGRRFVVVDAPRAVALHLDATAPGLVCRGSRRGVRGPAASRSTASRSPRPPHGALAPRRQSGELARIDGVAPAALAANAQGDLVVVDAASTHLGFFRARA
ncbi:MAG: hypothetical protein H6701_12765 [Myxococcales bacterium]|nr:hypothetical protein [Myxococcales bacterium]